MDDVLLIEAESAQLPGMYLDRGLIRDFHIKSVCSKTVIRLEKSTEYFLIVQNMNLPTRLETLVPASRPNYNTDRNLRTVTSQDPSNRHASINWKIREEYTSGRTDSVTSLLLVVGRGWFSTTACIIACLFIKINILAQVKKQYDLNALHDFAVKCTILAHIKYDKSALSSVVKCTAIAQRKIVKEKLLTQHRRLPY
ncbi:hypothetical protein J6590_081669 [Homalodisca vitripennis]|nr:hypothetical protein J6590_081669 [Homalodisca vitripennis]